MPFIYILLHLFIKGKIIKCGGVVGEILYVNVFDDTMVRMKSPVHAYLQWEHKHIKHINN